MWSFDIKKTENRIKLLQDYYKTQKLQACEFDCYYRDACEKSQLPSVKSQYLGGTAAVMPLYDVSYQNQPIRVLIVGKETGYMKNSTYGTSPNFETNNRNVLNCINWEKKNNHIKGTLYVLQNIFGIQTEYVYSSYALSNLLRCSFQNAQQFCNVSGTRDTSVMRNNCVLHLLEEIKILDPTLIITQGEWAIKGRGFVDVLSKCFGNYETVRLNNSGKYGLYKFEKFHCITTHHPAILGNWVKNLAPDSVWPMLDQLRIMGYLPIVPPEANVAYEKFAKGIVDPVIATLSSNDFLRG